MGKTPFLRFFQTRVFVDLLVIGGLLVTISMILILSSQGFRFYFVAFLLVIAAAATGKFSNEFGLKSGIKPGVELHFYAGIMITYLSSPWIGALAIFLSFYLMNRIQPVFKAAVGRENLNKWTFVEGVQDMIQYVFFEYSMWVYVVLVFAMPFFYFLPPLVLWNAVSFVGSVTDAIINKFIPVDRPDDIGRAPWKRLVFYAILFSIASPLIISFVLDGALYL